MNHLRKSLIAGSLLVASTIIGLKPPVAAKPQTAKPVVYPATASVLKKTIAARKGKVVLVNFWATWCPPCVKEFPALTKLQKNYSAKGLSVVFISANEGAERKTKVEPFLKQQRVIQPTYIVQGDQSLFFRQFDPKVQDSVGFPRTYIYNRKGKLVKLIEGEDKTYQQFEKLIKPHL